MSNTVNISAKIPKSLKKKIEKMGINVSKTVREALSREVEKEVRAKTVKRLERSRTKALPPGTIVKVIREIREEN